MVPIGYDMTWREVPPEERVAVEAARAEASAAYSRREHIGASLTPAERLVAQDYCTDPFSDDVPAALPDDASPTLVAYVEAHEEGVAAYARADELQRSYFRLNIWSMTTMRAIMDMAGVLSFGATPVDLDLSDDEATVWQQYDDAEAAALATPRLRQLYEQARAKVEAYRGAELEDEWVAAYKFASNEGWWVTPRECRIIAKGLRQMTLSQLADALDAPNRDYRTGFESQLAAVFARPETVEAIVAAVDPSLSDKPLELAGVEQTVTSSEDGEQLLEWARHTMAFAAYNDEAAEHGGYEVF